MLDDLPPFLTVCQAAEVLQLGRSKTYELTVEWERPAVDVASPSSGSAARSASPGPPWSASSRTSSGPPRPSSKPSPVVADRPTNGRSQRLASR